MNNISRIIGGLLFVMLFCTATTSRAQYWLDDCGGTGSIIHENNAGQEFLLCYMQNELPSWADINATYQDVYLAALDEVDDDGTVTVTITCKAFPNYREVLKLSKRGSITYHISRVLSQFVLIYSNEVVDDMVVRVTSSQPIVCYGMNHKQFTADAFLALPRNVAAMEYMVMSYPNSTLSSDDGRQSEFAVAAFDDNTVIEIIPSCDTRAGSAKGTVMTFVLDSGQCVQVQASDFNLTNDLTGSRIHSLNYPVVVYGGHVRAEVPAGFRYPQSESTSRDHLCESLPPVSTWGHNFICNTFKNADVVSGDVVRVLASVNNTVVKINGVVWGSPLAAGAHRDTMIKKTVAIETSEPSLVGMFAHTTEVNNGLGDPFFAVIPPLNQTYNDFTFFISEDEGYNDNNYVIVVSEVSGIGNVELDGVKIPAISFQNIPTALGGKNYAIATLNVLAGPHRVYTPNMANNGVTILAYGFGNVDSYGYTAGALLKPLQGIIADDFTFAGVPPGETPRSEIRFRSMLNEKVWLDSAVMTNISNPRYTVRTKKNIAYDISSMTAGQKLAVEVEAFPPPDEILFGEMTVHHHTTKWRGLRPATVPFVIYPKQAASVNEDQFADRSVTVYPNPVIGDNGSVTLRVEGSTSVKLRLYDATGREVLTIPSRRISSDETVNFPTRGLASGSYVLEVSMPELNRTERRHILIQK
ncbi:MAG TPA: T9SS type A sorting domain-containing protein [Candidatus Kapabacteria bacterium]